MVQSKPVVELSAAMEVGSSFVIGGRVFEVPQLAPEYLHVLCEAGRNVDLDDPIVCKMLTLATIYAALLPSYADITPAWLNAHLTSEAAQGVYQNLAAQKALAIAARKAPAISVARN